MKKNKIPIQKAIKHIKKNYTNQNLSLIEIAGVAERHPRSFCRSWNQTMEDSLTGYINNLRVEKAKELLQNSSLNANKIARQVGFTPKHFCRVFKSSTGISPIRYRNKIQ